MQPLVPWSDQDQEILTRFRAGFLRITERFVVIAADFVAPWLESAAPGYSVAQLSQTLTEHCTRLLDDPRRLETMQRSFRVGTAHRLHGIRPSWYLATYNGFFRAYHVEQELQAADLPPLELVRRRWLWDVSAALDAYDEKAQQELQMMMERVDSLTESAYRDPLTTIPNRRAIEEIIERHVRERWHCPAWFVLLDLDGFKAINDECGHAAGDNTLRRFGEDLAEAMAESWFLARVGGDEFCFWIPAEHAPNRLAELFRAMIARCTFSSQDLSFSLGAAAYPGDGETFAQLYAAADQALYVAKVGGKGRLKIRGNHPLYALWC